MKAFDNTAALLKLSARQVPAARWLDPASSVGRGIVR
jgi:hypothetical protein